MKNNKLAKNTEINDNKRQNPLQKKDNDKIENIKLKEKTIDLAKNAMGTINNITNNIREIEQIKNKTAIRQAEIISDYEKDMRIIDKKFEHQDRELIKSDLLLNKGLEDNNLDMIKEALAHGATIANTNPVKDITNKLNQKLKNDTNNDEFIEI